jgi:hypothetical protein
VLSVAAAVHEVPFREHRYIYVLDKNVTKEGVIRFDRRAIDVAYSGSDQKLSYLGDSLIVTDKERQERIDLRNDPTKKLFFLFLDAIYHDKRGALESYFILTEERYVTLMPKPAVASFIKRVRYKKEKRLVFLDIELVSGDRIVIEERE